MPEAKSIIEQARVIADSLVEKARVVALELVEKSRKDAEEIAEAAKAKMYIDISRIPLICQSVVGIHSEITEIKTLLDKKFVTREAFWPVKTLVYSAAGSILLIVFTALVYKVVTK